MNGPFDVSRGVTASRLSRRHLLKATALTTAALACPAIRPVRAETEKPSLDAARKEGSLVLWHADQEGQTLDFLKVFTEKTGLQVKQQHILPGVAFPKLIAEIRAGMSDVDVFCGSDAILEEARKRGFLLEYRSPELDAYGPAFRSNPPGFWTAYYSIANIIMYNPKIIAPSEAPKTWVDLLDPKFKNSVGVQTAAAGTQYLWWYLLRPIVPADYWTRLQGQKVRAYESSTQMVKAIVSGELKVGGKVSDFQYVQGARRGEPLEGIYPAEGVPTGSQVGGIVKSTKRPNAAKIFWDFLLSKEGQAAWNTSFGSHSPRADVKIPGVRSLTDYKLLTVTDLADYSSPQRLAEFTELWNKVTGF